MFYNKFIPDLKMLMYTISSFNFFKIPTVNCLGGLFPPDNNPSKYYLIIRLKWSAVKACIQIQIFHVRLAC